MVLKIVKISNKKNENVTASILIWGSLILFPISFFVEQPWNLSPRLDSTISLLYLVAKLLGKEDAMIRLTGSLEVDITKTNDVLGWFPPFTVNEGLQRACVNFNNEKIIK